MPSGLFDQKRGVRAGRDQGGDFGQMQVHRVGVAAGHDESRALAVLGADRSEDIGGGGSLVFRGARARAALGPAAGDLVLLAARASSANQTSMAVGSRCLSRRPTLLQAGLETS